MAINKRHFETGKFKQKPKVIIDISFRFYLLKLHEIYILHQFSCDQNQTPNVSSTCTVLSTVALSYHVTLRENY